MHFWQHCFSFNPDGIEAIKTHAAILAKPVREAKNDKKVTDKRWTDKKLTSGARKQKVKDQEVTKYASGVLFFFTIEKSCISHV